MACDSGYYSNGSNCIPCHSSCKECTSGGACTTCEMYMFHNSTSQLCEYCPDGEFHDHTWDLCRNCDDRCEGYCSYKTSCFECASDQVLDLDSFTCVSSCDPSTKEIVDATNYNLQKFCRGNKFYIDPTQDGQIELGTIQYPYRTILPAFDEILLHFSHSDSEVEIYVKGGTTNYVQESKIFIINMTSVTITTYNGTTSPAGFATIYSTDQSVEKISKKAAFHLMKDLSVDLNPIISGRSFSDSEKLLIGSTDAAFEVIRTSITMDNIIARRVASSEQTGVFLYLIYLQTKTMRLTNMEFHLTGSLVTTNDPMNIYMENIYADTYNVKSCFYFLISCNYPEAFVTPYLTMKNITMFTSKSAEVVDSRAQFLVYSGSGNITGTNWDLTDAFHLKSSGAFNGYVYGVTECNPDDGITRYLELDTISSSTPHNEDLSRTNSFIFAYSSSSILRRMNFDVKNIHIEDFKATANGAFGFSSKDNATFTNIYARNYQITEPMLFIGGQENLIITNVTLMDAPSQVQSSLILNGVSNDLIISNISYNNFTGSLNPSAGSIFLFGSETSIIFENVTVENCDFQNQVLFQPIAVLESFGLRNVVVQDSRITTGLSFFSLLFAKQIQVDGISLSGVTTTDETTNSGFSLIHVTLFDMATTYNSEIKNSLSINSSITVCTIGTFYKYALGPKFIQFKNMKFQDSEIQSPLGLVNMNQVSTTFGIYFSFDNITFSNIKFTSSGYLFKFDHQLPTNVTMTNCVFENIENGYILSKTPKTSETSIFTRVSMDNITVNNVKETTNPFLSLTDESKIYVSASHFTNIYSFFEGSVVSGGDSKTETIIQDSIFQNNTAQKGAVFYISDQSSLKCTNCTITNNYAIISGVVEVTLNGKFEFYQCLIYDNYANSNPVSLILDSALLSQVNNCTIYNNIALTKAQITEEFTSCSKLCFVNSEYKTYSNDHFTSSFIEDSDSQLFQVISGSLSILNNSIIYDQSVIVNGFVSTILFEDSVIENITLTDTSIQSVFTTLTMNRMVIRNINNTNNFDFILVMLDSHFTVSSLNYSLSNSILFRTRTSSVDITDIRFDTITGASQLWYASNCFNASISGIYSSDSQITKNYLFSVVSSHNISISNIYVHNSESVAMRLTSSNITSLSNLDLLNCYQGIIIQSSVIDLIQNSTFKQTGDVKLISGAALSITDSSVNIQNSSFVNNTAISGGALYFTCSSLDLCSLNISDTTFSDNTAVEKGGAVYYDYARPNFGYSIIFANNSAQYGQNIASYAVKITFSEDPNSSLRLDNFGSGIAYPEVLRFAVRDYDNQVMNLNSQNQILITAIDSNTTEVRGYNSAQLKQGVAEFDNLILVANPGLKNIEVSATSRAIDQTKIEQIFGSQISTNRITTDIRYCQPGEEIDGNICRECSPGTYSLIWNSTTCTQCFEDVVCEGGTKINVHSGFWRRNLNSTSIVECENKDACDGGFVNDYNNPTECATGYTGNLCTKCALTDDSKYQETSQFVCQKCPNPALNAIRVAGVGLAVFIFFMIIIVVNVRKTSESSMSILLRILTNYAQILTTTISFSSSHPDLLTDALIPFKNVSDSSTAFMSFDCFIIDYEIKGPFPSNSFFKLFCLIFLPLAVFLVVALIWIVAYLIRRAWVSDIRRYLIISFISVIFLMHPKLAQSGIDVFRCIRIEKNVFKVRIDSDIDCYSMKHIKLCLILGVPILVFWVISLPIVALVLMYKNVRVENETNEVQKYFLILYQGVKRKHFYWEFVNSARKIAILITFLLPENLQILFSLSILVSTWRLQSYLQPYKNNDNNEIEILGVNVGMITLCCGMVYNSPDTNDTLNFFLLLLLLILNIIFITKWLHLIILSLAEKSEFFKSISDLISKFILFKKVKTSGNGK